MNFRNAVKEDCESIVLIHLSSFNNFFLTTLGHRFLRIYYSSCIKSNEAITIISSDETGHVTGFAVGCIKAEGFHRRLLLSNKAVFIVEGISLLFSRPGALIRLALNLTKKANDEDDGEYAELLSIAVSKSLMGEGIGKDLINEFEMEVKRRGGNKVSLTTDYYDNDKVISFYMNSEYSIVHDFVSYPKRRMYRLMKNI